MSNVSVNIADRRTAELTGSDLHHPWHRHLRQVNQ